VFERGFVKGFTGAVDAAKEIAPLVGLKKGGKIHKTGAYYLHKGERVLNEKQTKAYDAAKKKRTKKRKSRKKRKTKK
jgi:hypothetical protein